MKVDKSWPAIDGHNWSNTHKLWAKIEQVQSQ